MWKGEKEMGTRGFTQIDDAAKASSAPSHLLVSGSMLDSKRGGMSTSAPMSSLDELAFLEQMLALDDAASDGAGGGAGGKLSGDTSETTVGLQRLGGDGSRPGPFRWPARCPMVRCPVHPAEVLAQARQSEFEFEAE